ncbi:MULTISPECIES: hypothetical protein [unclassified Nocardia]|uniref:hypothetical protein n=1 Tax=unclassified Nocardia TaxID=2637762 RepID=UPI001CE3EB93|nr:MULTISPECIES: hypothetical protein [unclassified Nocardia]
MIDTMFSVTPPPPGGLFMPDTLPEEFQDSGLGEADMWAMRLIEARHIIEHSLTQLENAQPTTHTSVLDAARRLLSEQDQKLARHRAALEAGADPELIAEWTREVRKERELAAAQIAAIEQKSVTGRRMSRQEILQMVDNLGGLLAILKSGHCKQARGVPSARLETDLQPRKNGRSWLKLRQTARGPTGCVRRGT